MHNHPLLVEIRCEELPPNQVGALARGFPQQLLSALKAANFADARADCLTDNGAPLLLATPRRFAAVLTDIAASAAQRTVCRRGPALNRCHDADGAPTKALSGFMRSVGAADIGDLVEIEENGQSYIAYRENRGGEKLSDALPAILQEVLLAINAPRLMRWGDNDFKFIRPVRGVLMQHGDNIIPGTVLGVAAGAHSIGHPTLAMKTVPISTAAAYEKNLSEEGKVIVDINKRKAIIAQQLEQPLTHPRLLDEVSAMCEYPAVYRGAIDETLLSLPAFCIEECMIKHQRAFPIYQDGALTADYHFVADNRPRCATQMINGFNAVLHARLRDVQFYLAEDGKLSLTDALAKLKNIVYHHRLGSQWQRVMRLGDIAQAMGQCLHLTDEAQQRLQQAAKICKSDLSTLMISEYPKLEGLVAALYFCADNPAVARLVRHHNQKNWRAGVSDSAEQNVFCALILAIQLEKLIGLYSAGEILSGSKDPHGLRQAATIIAEALSHCCPEIPLDQALAAAAAAFQQKPPPDLAPVKQFIIERKRQELLDDNISAAVLNAVTAAPINYLSEMKEKATALNQFLTQPSAAFMIAAHKRINNLLRKSTGAKDAVTVQPALFQQEAEQHLYERLTSQQAAAKAEYMAVLSAIADMHHPVDAFFSQVRVNVDDEKLRANRLALLKLLCDFFNTVGDLSKLSGGE